MICPENKNLVIVDMGSRNSVTNTILGPNDIKKVLEAYSEKYPKARINIIITHGDTDHYKYFPEVFSTSGSLINKVDHIILGGSRKDYKQEMESWLSSNCEKFLIFFPNGGEKCFGKECLVDDGGRKLGVDFCGKKSKVKFEILAANLGTTKNSKSIILRVDYLSWSMLLPGDFEEAPSIDQLISHYKRRDPLQSRLHVNMYKISHHGASGASTEANSEKFLSAIKPNASFASQAYPSYGYHHPRCEVLDRLLKVTKLNKLNSPLHYDFPCYQKYTCNGRKESTYKYEDECNGGKRRKTNEDECNGGKRRKTNEVTERSDVNMMDIHLTCPQNSNTGSVCSTLMIVSDGKIASVYYIPVKKTPQI